MTAFFSTFLFLVQNSIVLWIWVAIFTGIGFWQAYLHWFPWRSQVAMLEEENAALKEELGREPSLPEVTLPPVESPKSRPPITSFAEYDRTNRRRRFGEEPTFGCRACERPDNRFS